ncbi:hypothetical protein O5O45_09165 [Hahella aquimaris]|uniref:hypothetical protein n=1 Tax=Hahella sp. HNIBRBA332 TaxID=3015983 RepID=UPI00273AD261|nr:hypothetical protein [Hahella sp. HNIBRBA332]WLQ16083.1 hypothetical protein O5O45_09165 [Hahella sp. HNIBRBA332]
MQLKILKDLKKLSPREVSQRLSEALQEMDSSMKDRKQEDFKRKLDRLMEEYHKDISDVIDILSLNEIHKPD